MPIEILMPALSPTMTEGNLAKWTVKEGDTVESGDVIAEIETDKATMEVEAVDEGVVGKILVPDGTAEVAVNQVIALLLEEDEDPENLNDYKPSGPAANTQGAAEEPAQEEQAEPQVTPSTAPTTVASGERVKASPLARRIAEQKGVSLAGLTGSGPHGRIVKADVENAKAGAAPATAGAAAPIAGRNPQETTEIPVSTMRGVIAKRLLESKQEVPHFYLTIDLEIDQLLAARKQINEAADGAFKVSVNDMVVKAVAMGLRDVPAANASWGGDKIIQYNNVDISVAVAIDGGLITPIVKNADQKTLSTMSNELKDLINRAREGKLQPHEFQGGGFSISNLGMFGIKQFQAIINPPQSCILAIGSGEKRVVVGDNGEFKAVNMMTVSLSSDHRVVDGAVGAQFLAAFKRYIENPLGMLV
jgi:pyruvate dehydrogenase E2 component (dihydrolipoamide acetyltransferase)